MVIAWNRLGAEGCPLLLTTCPVKIVSVDVPAVLVTVRETANAPSFA